MAAVPINDAEFRFNVLRYLVCEVDAGQVPELLNYGLSMEALEALRHCSMRDITRIAQDSSIPLELHIDSGKLTTAFQRLHTVMRERELLEYYVRHQMPSALLARLFKLNAKALREMRVALRGTANDAQGRPSLPPLEAREAIHAAWEDIMRREHVERERYFALHQRFPDFTIAALWQVLNEFGKADLDAPGTPQRSRTD